MADVLIRAVPPDVLSVLREEAASEGRSVQAYLLETLDQKAVWVRRQRAIAASREFAQRFGPLSLEDRDAAIDEARSEVESRYGDDA